MYDFITLSDATLYDQDNLYEHTSDFVLIYFFIPHFFFFFFFLHLHLPTNSLEEPMMDQQGSYIDERKSFTRRYVTDKWNSWFDDVMFDKRHVMETTVEYYNQTRRFITFLRRLFYKIYIKTSQIRNKNDVETKYKYKIWIHFSDIHRSMNAKGLMQN